MDQNDSDQNQNLGIFQSAQTYIILAIVIVAAIVFFSTRDNQNQNGSEEGNQNQTNEQTTGENVSSPQDATIDAQNTDNTVSSQSGNVSAEGVLKASDSPQRGNLMVDSNNGKIYIQTSRDFSSLVDKPVTLNAAGSLDKFVFLGFDESTIDTTAMGGAAEEAPVGNVSFSGTLKRSNSSAGNYTITSGGTTVYLKSVRDYSSLIDSTVNLSATGTINSFTNAVVTKA